MWDEIQPDKWQEVPAINDRPATEDDVKDGLAVFFIEGESSAVPRDLPKPAIQKLDDGQSEKVVVIQAEQTATGVILGVRPLSGGNAVCMESEIEYVDEFAS